MQRNVEPLLVPQAHQQVVDPDDVVGVARERRPEYGGDPIVFSSTWGSTSSGPIVYLSGWRGIIRGSTSK